MLGLRFPFVCKYDLQRVLFAGFVTEVEGGKGFPSFREGVEIGCEWDARYHF